MVVGALLATVVAVGLVALTGGLSYGVAGLTDPGDLTRYGIMVVRVGADLAAAVCIGSLLLAAFLVPPQKSGTLDVDGYASRAPRARRRGCGSCSRSRRCSSSRPTARANRSRTCSTP